MMTRGGTNTLRGSANYTHWHNRLNSPKLQQKVTFKQDPSIEKAWRAGREHIGAFTLGGPLVIPKVIDGRNKAFFFGNFSMSNDSAPGRLAGNSTVPANRSTSTAISPTCCCCRQAPGPPRRRATISTRSSIP